MSWLLNLYETYEANLSKVGEINKKYNEQEYTLLPVSHTTQNAHIEVAVTEEGDFHSATVIDKKDATTLIPCTEDSASRAGAKVAPYPLHDKLSYTAGDFTAYGGKIKKEVPFSAYIKQLQDWAESPHANKKVKSIYTYLKKERLITDLVREKVLFLDEKGMLIDKWDKKYEKLHGEKPAVFSVVAGGQESAFVRFTVHSPNEILTEIWKDKEVYDSFINYYEDKLKMDELCFVSGKWQPSTERHANKIRNAADKAKLISANDTSGFTYRGRFNKSTEAAAISYDVSQKAHNALKWLINQQGKIIDQRVFLFWGNEKPEILQATEDTNIFLQGWTQETDQEIEIKSYTNIHYAREIAKAIDSYSNKIKADSKVNILVLDSATTGRMAVLYYRNMVEEHYLEKLKKWHSECFWLHKYKGNTKGFYGAPSTKDMAFAVYGPRANDKVVKGFMERMLPCIIDDKKTPQDILRSIIQRASNPVSMEKWEWEKTLSIACALINRQEGYDVALDKQNNDRSYLFGRLLAIADVLERNALDGKESRATNAIRYMNSFSRHPERTWKTIQEALQPYQARLGQKAHYYSILIDEVASKFSPEDFNNKPLTGKYLLGFYSQRHELYQKRDKNKKTESTSATN